MSLNSANSGKTYRENTNENFLCQDVSSQIVPTSFTLRVISRLNKSVFNYDKLHACSGKLSDYRLVQSAVYRGPITNYLPHETIFQLRKFSSAAFFRGMQTLPVLYSVQKQLINVISGKHNKTQFSQSCIWNIRIIFNTSF